VAGDGFDPQLDGDESAKGFWVASDPTSSRTRPHAGASGLHQVKSQPLDLTQAASRSASNRLVGIGFGAVRDDRGGYPAEMGERSPVTIPEGGTAADEVFGGHVQGVEVRRGTCTPPVCFSPKHGKGTAMMAARPGS
jgi:hypothetical protein